MPVKILILRKMSKEQETAANPFLLKLNTLAQKQSGFISGERYTGFNAPEERLIICSWKSIEDWEAFNQLNESKELHYTIDQILVRPSEHRIYEAGHVP